MTVILTIAPIPNTSVAHAKSDETEPPSSTTQITLTFNEVLQPEQPPGLSTIVIGKSNQDLTDEQPVPKPVQKSVPRVQRIANVSVLSETSDAESLVSDAFGPDQWQAFYTIVQIESGWNPQAYNKKSTACGLGQQDPCNGLNTLSFEDQVKWVISYIQHHIDDDTGKPYGTPEVALEYHLRHHWY